MHIQMHPVMSEKTQKILSRRRQNRVLREMESIFNPPRATTRKKLPSNKSSTKRMRHGRLLFHPPKLRVRMARQKSSTAASAEQDIPPEILDSFAPIRFWLWCCEGDNLERLQRFHALHSRPSQNQYYPAPLTVRNLTGQMPRSTDSGSSQYDGESGEQTSNSESRRESSIARSQRYAILESNKELQRQNHIANDMWVQKPPPHVQKAVEEIQSINVVKASDYNHQDKGCIREADEDWSTAFRAMIWRYSDFDKTVLFESTWRFLAGDVVAGPEQFKDAGLMEQYRCTFRRGCMPLNQIVAEEFPSPKPDYVGGYHFKNFTENERSTLFLYNLAIQETLAFPWIAADGISSRDPDQELQLRIRATATALLRNLGALEGALATFGRRPEAADSERPDGDPPPTSLADDLVVFTFGIQPCAITLWAHYIEPSVNVRAEPIACYITSMVDRWSTFDHQHMLEARNWVRKTMRWGLNSRLDRIKEAVGVLSRRRCLDQLVDREKES